MNAFDVVETLPDVDVAEEKQKPRKTEGVEYWKALREILKAQSQGAKLLVKAGAFNNVNEALLYGYAEQVGNNTFHGLGEWKKQGFRVKREEFDKFFMLWSAPLKKVGKKVVKAEDSPTTDEANEAEKSRALWGIKKVWHEGQVEKNTAVSR